MERFKFECRLDMKIIALRLQADVYKVKDQFLNSFLWRNFTYYMRKEGKSYTPYCLACIFISIAYILVFFPTVAYEPKPLLAPLRTNEASILVVINFAVY